MKVLMIEHYLPDSIYSLELGRELKNYCDLSILCRENAGVQEEGITWLPYFYAGGSGKIKAMTSYGMSLNRLAAVIRKGNYEVVHIQTFKNAKYEIPLYYKMRKYFKKLVLTVHNVLPHEVTASDKQMYGAFYNFCDELIVHNHASGKCLVDTFHIPESKITVIPHGAYQTHLTRKAEKIEDGMKYFLQFGVIRKYKGIDILLEAIALLEPEKRKNLRFLIAGKQYSKLDNTDYQKKIRELGIEECVTFREEHISDEEIPKLFGQTDFVLFPYRNIYGSGALLLAYTYNKPVIASDIPTFLEETDQGRTGLLFESENPRALADAVWKAAGSSQEQMEKYQTAITELVEEKYNWKISAVKTAEVYQK